MKFNKIAFTDIDGVLRGKYISTTKLKKRKIGYCDVVFGWDINDNVYLQDSVTGWHSGFPDGMLTIDTNSERLIPWENSCPMYLSDFSDDENLKKVCPRSLLKDIVSAYHKLGIYPKVGFEYEWFNFEKTSETLENPQKNTITQGMFGYSLLRLQESKDFVKQLLTDLPSFNIDIEGFHTETGPGVYEMALQYKDAVNAADDAILFKQSVKEIGLQHQIIASFMAKWNTDLPGCGAHIHVSLHDKEGKNLMNLNTIENTHTISTQFLEGIMLGIAPLLPLYAPTINSYKRLTEGSWAATSVSWGYQNRTTAVRLITDYPENHHIEMRVPGSDTNPYLALYAILASGLYGITQQLKLQHKEQKGNAYENDAHIKLPKSLEEAVKLMETDSFPSKVLNKTFLEHYLMTRKWEVQQYQKSVTDWELKRYLEII
ncbi:glutamine synthetase family protein [Lutibacter sp. B1]|uniref:glutamine synthetase family protein n=1 Tax=Lutibacter sp. B1 TaxID=2725996 RepID=UPI001456F572|nr:glutamine synthetase family protein [Lutibacter sp. B1]NLP57585.1 glutamine synthetase [Lutibacter sp. B1]